MTETRKPLRRWGGRAESQPCPPLPGRESLPLPYLKQEELPSIPSAEPPCPVFQYVLCAATSPAVRQQEETLTYLNQGMLLGRVQALEARPRMGWGWWASSLPLRGRLTGPFHLPQASPMRCRCSATPSWAMPPRGPSC